MPQVPGHLAAPAAGEPGPAGTGMPLPRSRRSALAVLTPPAPRPRPSDGAASTPSARDRPTPPCPPGGGGPPPGRRRAAGPVRTSMTRGPGPRNLPPHLAGGEGRSSSPLTVDETNDG